MNASLPQAIYPTSLVFRIAMSLLGALFLGVALLGAAAILFGEKPEEFLVFPLIMIFSFGCLVFGVACIRVGFKSQLEIYSDRIRLIGAFKNKEILLSELVGCKLPKERLGDLLLFFKGSTQKVQRVKIIYKNKMDILKWFREKFPADHLSLSEQNLKEEKEAFLKDPKFGANEEQRLQVLQKNKWRISAIGRVCFYGSLVLAIAPSSFKFATWVLIALPILTIIASRFLNGLNKYRVISKVHFSPIWLSIWYAMVAMNLRAYLGWEILDWNSFWLPWSVISFIIFAVFLLCRISATKNFGVVISIFFLSVLATYGLTINLNGALESFSNEIYQVQILNKEITIDDHNRKHYCLVLTSWKYMKSNKYMQVDSDKYNDYKVGGTIKITVHRGLLGIRWYTNEGHIEIWEKIKTLFVTPKTL